MLCVWRLEFGRKCGGSREFSRGRGGRGCACGRRPSSAGVIHWGAKMCGGIVCVGGGLCAVFSCHQLQLTPPPLQVMRGHTNNIVDIAWSPDAKQIASAW